MKPKEDDRAVDGELTPEEKVKQAELYKKLEAARLKAEAAEKKPKPTKETAKIQAAAMKKAALRKEGFYDCTMVEVVKDQNNNIVKLGKTVKNIKAMHETNIDVYNTQQENSGLFIKKEGAKYVLIKVDSPGRKTPRTMFVESETATGR